MCVYRYVFRYVNNLWKKALVIFMNLLKHKLYELRSIHWGDYVKTV